ncbi:hypothetical protein ASPWEDRAFT_25946 [Aspergillus wentii DTO 134E9]|uniref:Uncharacterized protein n=1 Tax=Aspergillus wentii DTO 134E9 TaxID=1073089 RepID=A0A1L9RNF6_ASPWE|nr:uncharacterized protein ASPWEDRAFT_25946 [Aspergillus wentii DTO 134E9]OJJ36479.1 hypothetical protein ASPWEDRAFT_25946 [Aspergillus wentii DTO 134E9]
MHLNWTLTLLALAAAATAELKAGQACEDNLDCAQKCCEGRFGIKSKGGDVTFACMRNLYNEGNVCDQANGGTCEGRHGEINCVLQQDRLGGFLRLCGDFGYKYTVVVDDDSNGEARQKGIELHPVNWIYNCSHEALAFPNTVTQSVRLPSTHLLYRNASQSPPRLVTTTAQSLPANQLCGDNVDCTDTATRATTTSSRQREQLFGRRLDRPDSYAVVGCVGISHRSLSAIYIQKNRNRRPLLKPKESQKRRKEDKIGLSSRSK